MTQEDKYKEALLEARAVLEPCLKYSRGKVREALDSIDKELKSFESEDERIRKELIEYHKQQFENNRDQEVGLFHKAAIAYLEKQKEQKPTWSEEDESMLWNIISIVGQCKSVQADSMLAWLKSLRPSWKPSEEQMEALRRAVNKLAKTDVADSVRLSIMYDNLNKL